MNKVFIFLFFFGVISGGIFLSVTDFYPKDDDYNPNVFGIADDPNIDPHENPNEDHKDEVGKVIQEHLDKEENIEGEKAPHYSNNKQLLRTLNKIKSFTAANRVVNGQYDNSDGNGNGLPPAPPVHANEIEKEIIKDEQYHLNSLYSDDPTIVREGMRALAKAKNKRAIASIAGKVWDKRSKLSTEAIKSLKEIDQEAYREVLLTAIEDSDAEVQGAALWGMAVTQFPEANVYIKKFLKSPSKRLQLTAISSMGQVKDPSFLPLLQKLAVESKNEEVKQRAEEATLNLIQSLP